MMLREILSCTYCGKQIKEITKSQKDGYRRRGRIYCSAKCGKEYSRKISSETMAKTNKKYASKRMKENNPMKNEETRKKVSQKLKGHKPSVIFGNGRGLTIPQEKLFNLLSQYGAITEYAISTKGFVGNYPNNYKVDIALPKYNIAIEIDGNSHRAYKRKIEDIKKTKLLQNKGWKVIRFWNDEINNNIENCLKEIEAILYEVST